jgi:glycosyltransferase involved in cell wall biosynthesis
MGATLLPSLRPVTAVKCYISVVVPVFNRRDVISRAVASLVAQDTDRSFEIVVVDDGSMDGSADIAAALGDRVRVIRQENRGPAAARLRGIQEARGEFVAFLDSDDVAEPYYLSCLWEALHTNKEAVLAFARVADLEGKPFSIERLPPTEAGMVKDPLLTLLQFGCFTASMNLMTYRNIALQAATGRERFKAANDYDFTIRASLAGPFAFVDRFSIRCDRRSDGISTRLAASQAGYAVLAARDGVRQSGRRDAAIRSALDKRLRQLWPSAFVQLSRTGELKLALQVAAAGMRSASLKESLRYLWWSCGSAAQTT